MIQTFVIIEASDASSNLKPRNYNRNMLPLFGTSEKRIFLSH